MMNKINTPHEALNEFRHHLNLGFKALERLIQPEQPLETVSWVTVKEFAKELSVSTQTVQKYRKKGILKEGEHWQYLAKHPRKPVFRYKSKSYIK